ncbi:MAG: hypothetical protein ACFFDT_21990 [Candidatus Hodarchaeota archaeon]
MSEHDKAVEDFTACVKLYPKGTPMAIASSFRLAKTFTKLANNFTTDEHMDRALSSERQNVGSELVEV